MPCSAAGSATSKPESAAVRRIARAAGAALAALGIEVVLVHLLWRRPVKGQRRLALADALTLSRGLAAAPLVALAVEGRGATAGLRWSAWAGLLWGATLSDWLDGPLARRWGASPGGVALDLEADSWLTLMAAWAAVTAGGLPRWSVLPPIARYGLPALGWRDGRYLAAKLSPQWWGRATGTAQMMLFVAALAPVASREFRGALAPIAGPVAVFQLTALLVQLARLLRCAAREPGD